MTTSHASIDIQTLFREQGITIACILMAIGVAIGVLVEALLPGGGTMAGGKPPRKDEKGVKEWLSNRLKALALLLGRLGVKAAEALPGIISDIQLRGGRGGHGPPVTIFLGRYSLKGALKFAIANVKYLTKYVKSSFSTNSKW